MKLILILATLLLATFEAANACINPCSGVTVATCTAPCFTCGLCSAKCCQSLFGRSESDRFLLPCLSGRQDNEVEDPEMDPGTSKTCYVMTFCKSPLFSALNELEMQSFSVCNNDGEPGLTWDEVDFCLVRRLISLI